MVINIFFHGQRGKIPNLSTVHVCGVLDTPLSVGYNLT